jgi:hypothetical protein
MEGYHKDKSTRKESWITASRFSTSNGAAPVPGARVHGEYAGKTDTQHADALGQLPPIAHPPKGVSPTNIKVIKPDGSWQTLVELAHGSKARTGVHSA